MRALGFWLGLFMLFLAGTVHAEKVEIIGMDFPPLTSAKEIAGLGHGTGHDLVVAAFKAVGVDANIAYRPMKRAIMVLKSKKAKYIMTGSSLLVKVGFPKEKISMVHSDNLTVSFCYFKSNHGGKDIRWKSLNDLKSYNTGILLGSPSIAILKKAGLKHDVTPSSMSIMKKLRVKRVDLWLNSVIAARFAVKQNFPELYSDFAETNPLYIFPSGISYWNDDPEVLKMIERFKKGLKIVVNDGTHQKIMRRYWGNDIPRDLTLESMKKRITW